MTPRFSRITNAVLDKGLILAYPPNTIQFQIALVSGFENIVLKHSGTVQSLLSSLQQSYGAS
jgi:hypothetical protein